MTTRDGNGIDTSGGTTPTGDVIVATADAGLWREVRQWIRQVAGLEAAAVGSSTELLDLPQLDRARLVVIDEALPGAGGLVTGAMVHELHPSARLILAVVEPHPKTRHMAEEIGFSMVMERHRSGFVLGGLGN